MYKKKHALTSENKSGKMKWGGVQPGRKGGRLGLE